MTTSFETDASHRGLAPLLAGLADPTDVLSALRLAAIGMCLVAPDGRLLGVNPALCRFFGREADDLMRRSWQELTYPDDIDLDLADLQRAFDGEIDTYRVTKRYLHATGDPLVGDLSVSAIRDEAGRVRHFVSQIVDVTRTARMQEALAQSEARFRLLAENASDVVVEVAGDETVRWISQSVTRVAGWEPEEVVGTKLITLVHPDDAASAGAVQENAKAGEPLRFECRMRTKTGTYRWFWISFRPVVDQGRPVSWVGSWRDIDDAVHARELAAQREAQFQMVAENTADVVWRVDADWRIEWVSPSVGTALGWEPGELLGRRAEEFVHPDDTLMYRSELAALDLADRCSFHVRMRRPDGTAVWFSDICTQIRDEHGEVVARVVGLRNIDAEVRATQALELSEQRFRLAMESAPGGMALVDLDRKFVKVNPALVDMLQRDEDWLVTHRVPDVLPEADQALDLRMRALVLSGRVSSSAQEHRLVRADGTLLWVQHSVGLLRDEDGTPLSYISQFLDVTEARESRRGLEFLATHDALTRLANRRALVDQMDRILSHQPRSGTRLGVLFLDLDGLKPINDRFGHASGDRVLMEVAQLIRDQVRADDLVARFGGDEFVALLPNVATLSDVRTIGDKIRQVIAEARDIADLGFPVTVSVGAAISDPGDSPDQVLSRADTAVYRAKASGGNRTSWTESPSQRTTPAPSNPPRE